MANQILSVSETEITIGDTITINCSKPSSYMQYFAFYLYVDNVQISSFSSLPYTLNYSFENSGTHIISLKGESYTGIMDIETVTVTVNNIDHGIGSWSINNKAVKNLQIGNKTIQTIETSDGAIIYQRPQGYELTLTSSAATVAPNNTVYLIATLTYGGEPVNGGVIMFNRTDANGNNPNTLAVNRQTDSDGIVRLGFSQNTAGNYYFMALLQNDNSIYSNVIQITVQNTNAGGIGIK